MGFHLTLRFPTSNKSVTKKTKRPRGPTAKKRASVGFTITLLFKVCHCNDATSGWVMYQHSFLVNEGEIRILVTYVFLLKKYIGTCFHIFLIYINIKDSGGARHLLAQVCNGFVLEVSSSNMTKTIQHDYQTCLDFGSKYTSGSLL